MNILQYKAEDGKIYTVEIEENEQEVILTLQQALRMQKVLEGSNDFKQFCINQAQIILGRKINIDDDDIFTESEISKLNPFIDEIALMYIKQKKENK